MAVSGVNISANKVTLTLDEKIEPVQVVRLSYTSGANPLQDLVGNQADDLELYSLTNNAT